MRYQRLTTDRPDDQRKAHVCRDRTVRDDDRDTPAQIEDIQLRRLADAVLSKSRDDLAALAETNPMLVWEWIEAFRNRRLAAEAETRYWSAAMATLSTAVPKITQSAAE